MFRTVETVTSPANPKVKEVVALQGSSSLRREKGLFVVEGIREVERCIAGGYEIRSLFFCPSIISADEMARLGNSAGRMFEVSEAVYGKMAYRSGTEGVVAVACCGKPKNLDNLPDLGKNPLVVAVESVEKPGNIGAMLRTGDAAGVDAFLVCDPHTDLYNPNLVRSSLGGVFTRNIAVCTSEEAIAWLKSRNIKILTAQLQDSELYYDTDMTCGTALVFGSEAEGLSGGWRKAADARIRIPMNGCVDSLNVSVSMAVLCYEALRQRNCAK